MSAHYLSQAATAAVAPVPSPKKKRRARGVKAPPKAPTKSSKKQDIPVPTAGTSQVGFVAMKGGRRVRIQLMSSLPIIEDDYQVIADSDDSPEANVSQPPRIRL